MPARSIMRANPAVLNGAPRSDVKTKADLGSCSRFTRRKARNSSPMIGWALGEPFLSCGHAALGFGARAAHQTLPRWFPADPPVLQGNDSLRHSNHHRIFAVEYA
jgi:hypothetical protein